MASMALGAYKRWSARHPWSVAFGTCWVKGCVADAASQLIVEKGKHPEGSTFDVRRNLVFSAYGGWYCGLVQHGVYNVLYTHLFGSAATVANALRKVAFDSVVHVPFVVFPVYYAYKHTFYDGDGAMAGLQRYSTEAVDMCGKYYSIWVPANMLMFTVVPPPLRIGFAASVSLAWLTVVSYLTHLTTSSSVASSSTSSSLSNRGTSEKEAFDARA